eukprot:5251863-Amphidinium_carterae.1
MSDVVVPRLLDAAMRNASSTTAKQIHQYAASLAYESISLPIQALPDHKQAKQKSRPKRQTKSPKVFNLQTGMQDYQANGS